MEQQTVTIAKAGIHASLNARCSVLAAANPVYGQYDRSRRPQDNIGLPDSLLSRFDLLFIILDQLDPTLDRKLSEYVVKSHQYRKPGTIMEPEPLNQRSKLILDTYDIEEDTNIWLKSGKNGDILTPEFLRKYIHYAKQRMEPVLSDDAMEIISNAYTIMRSKQTQRTLPVTARSLETIIRLSSASAKARLSQSVDSEDVDTALELLNYVLYHEGNSDDPDPNKGNNNYSGNLGSGFHQQSQIISDENMNNNNDHKRLRDKRDDDDDDDGLNYDHDQLHKTSLKYPKFNPDDEEEKWNIPIDKSSTKYEQVSKTIASINSETSQYEIAVKEIYLRLNESNPIGLSYERRELIAMLKELEIENKVINKIVVLMYLCLNNYLNINAVDVSTGGGYHRNIITIKCREMLVIKR
jgi:DNA replication licensing factor MCM3